MSAAENVAIVRRLTEEVYAGGNLAVIDEFIAPTYVYHGVSGDDPQKRDREWVRRIVRQLHEAFPDLTISIGDMLAEGDRVVTRFVQRGTHRGDLPWGPHGTVMRASGKQVEFGGIAISRLAGGKVVEDWEVMDWPGLWSQLGALPAPS